MDDYDETQTRAFDDTTEQEADGGSIVDSIVRAIGSDEDFAPFLKCIVGHFRDAATNDAHDDPRAQMVALCDILDDNRNTINEALMMMGAPGATLDAPGIVKGIGSDPMTELPAGDGTEERGMPDWIEPGDGKGYWGAEAAEKRKAYEDKLGGAPANEMPDDPSTETDQGVGTGAARTYADRVKSAAGDST